MTLSVSAYIIAPDGSTTDIPIPSDLAGFESARRNFYGAASQKYGLNLLSQLQDFTLLEVRGELLSQLLSEVEVLLNDTALDESGDYWRFRLNNIKTAAEVALKYGDAGAISIG